MRVVLIGHYSVPFPFSKHRLDYQMLKTWAGQMEQLDVIVQGSESRSQVWRDGNLVVHYAPLGVISHYVPYFLLWAASKLLNIHRKMPVDIVNGSDLWGGFIGVSLKYLMHAKVLAQLQGEFLPPSRFIYSAVDRQILYRVTRFVCRYADIIRCLYEAAADQLIALGIPKCKIAVVPSRCDIGIFNAGLFPPRSIEGHGILYVGNLISGKGVHFLLEALSEVVRKHPDTTLTIVGSGEQETVLRSLTKELGLSSLVFYLGRRAHDELPAIMHKADLFVFPSLSDATPRAVMEAMAMELPVVATYVGGIPEMIQDGATGLLVRKASARELADAIKWVFDNPEWAIMAGKGARQQVLKHYTLEKHIEQMVALHRRALAIAKEGD